MIHVAIILSLLTIGGLIWLFGKYVYGDDWKNAMTVFFFFALFWLLIATIIQIGNSSRQTKRFEELPKFLKAKAQIESSLQDNLILLSRQISLLSAEKRPAYEENIYNNITNEKVDLYFVEHSNLQAAKAISRTVAKIEGLQKSLNYYEEKVVETQRKIRYSNKSPWLLHGLIADPPEELIN